MTAFEVACDLIKAYVQRGDTREHIRSGYMGSFNTRYSASIGGYIGDKSYGNKFIVVFKIAGKEVNQVYKFEEIYNHCRSGQTVLL